MLAERSRATLVTGDSRGRRTPPLGSCCQDHRLKRSTGPPPPDTADAAPIRTLSLATKGDQEEGRSRVTRKRLAALIETGLTLRETTGSFHHGNLPGSSAGD
jgi:hypothetical protein